MIGYEAFSENAVRLFWNSEEAMEAKTAFSEKRKPDWSKF
jgi:1,4-dihydroxy-2-naphthoyl-CoA synthase